VAAVNFSGFGDVNVAGLQAIRFAVGEPVRFSGVKVADLEAKMLVRRQIVSASGDTFMNMHQCRKFRQRIIVRVKELEIELGKRSKPPHARASLLFPDYQSLSITPEQTRWQA
jgi:hypothetical protein